MDPQICFENFCALVNEGACYEAKECEQAYNSWISSGGGPAVHDGPFGEEFVVKLDNEQDRFGTSVDQDSAMEGYIEKWRSCVNVNV